MQREKDSSVLALRYLVCCCVAGFQLETALLACTRKQLSTGSKFIPNGYLGTFFILERVSIIFHLIG